jgi:tryptophan synthase alpha chain
VPYVLVDRTRRAALGRTVEALRLGGAAGLELGFPFSDPIADGPVLEAAHDRAVRAGTSWQDLLAACRLASGKLPVAVMTYANPLWNRGLARSLGDLGAAGATGVIVPDLSLEESPSFRRAAAEAGLDLVLLAAPGVARDRLVRIARSSKGFLYLVARYGTTGSGGHSAEVDLRPLVSSAHRAAPVLPVLLGFGVRDAKSAAAAMATGADGVIVGSALEERIAGGARPAEIARWLGALAVPPRAV